MKLHQLFPHFIDMSEDEQRISIAEYRERRNIDIVIKEPKRVVKKQTFDDLGLTPEEIAIAQKLNIKPSEIRKLRSQL